MRRLFALTLPLLMLSACGQTRTSTSSLGPTLTWLPSQLCDRWERCNGTNATPWGTERCEDWMERRLSNVVHARYDEGIRRGTLSVNPNAESACATLLGGTCEWEAFADVAGGLGGLGALGSISCGEVVVGRVAVGGDCVMDEECVGNAWCQQVSCMGGCHGVCVAPIAAGGVNCRRDADCAAGLACVFGAPSTCVALPIVGQACAPGEGRRCAFGARCEGGMCLDVSDTPNTLGAACGNGRAPCASGLFCSESGVCAAELSTGSACSNGLTGVGGRGCATGLWCAPSNQCSVALSVGDACVPTSGGGIPACSTPLVCGQGNVCITPRDNGEPCVSAIECASFNCAAARCTAPPYMTAG